MKDDSDFLQQCGISLDPKWLDEITVRDPIINLESIIEEESLPDEAFNYAKSLVRITNMLDQASR
jgi:hypothetical protein